MSTLVTLINRATSSAKSLIPDDIFSVKSLIYIRNRRGPKTDPCGTPADMFSQLDEQPFKITLCFLPSKKLLRILKDSPSIPFAINLVFNPSCHTLSKALDKSRKRARVSQ